MRGKGKHRTMNHIMQSFQSSSTTCSGQRECQYHPTVIPVSGSIELLRLNQFSFREETAERQTEFEPPENRKRCGSCCVSTVRVSGTDNSSY
ncbi:hypothetical protein WA026_009921 [Henosepilachna vigintioctopunctata]|uniref:Uncharacterized protein n=1 Tax=Henosepilachna vigintioctopunctata TaxID=420089 RepID=A0AAW1TUX1_9CUCU